jgi:CubicO group peptidase (beta-lactamase class C family)
MNFKDLVKPPAALGFRPDHLDRVRDLLQKGHDDKLYSAAVYCVMRHGMIAAHGALGESQPDASPPISTVFDTIFDMASVTKSMTGAMIMQCVEEGRLRLTNTVGRLLPESDGKPLAMVTVRQIATHTSGLPAWMPLYQSKEPVFDQILAAGLKTEPGAAYAYSDLGYITLGKILEKITETPLDRLVQERICKPLGMADSGYRPDPALRPRIAATAHHNDGQTRTYIGEVHDENALGMNGVAGHAGLFSTVPDLIRFALAYQFPAVASHLGIPPVLGVLARKLAQTIQCDPKVGSHGVGWFVWPSGYLPTGDLLSDKCYGHTGFTGTMILFDPLNDLCVILLTNRVVSTSDGSAFLTMRHLFANIIGGAVLA